MRASSIGCRRASCGSAGWDGRLIAALDAKSSQERAWQTGWSVRAGIEFQPNSTGAEARRRLSVQLQAYDGPAPYGQFYLENVKSVGLGLHFSLGTTSSVIRYP